MNEIKIGQWARIITPSGCQIARINSFKEYDEFYSLLVGETDYKHIVFKGDKFKADDNLEDLLEVKDIVHYDYLFDVKDKHAQIIHTEQILSHIQYKVKEKQIKITAIEPHENRVKQEIGSGEIAQLTGW